MNWRYLPLVSCVLLAAALGYGQSAPDHMKLFLLIGQSNMAGRGVIGPEDQVTNPRIFMLTKEETWVLAKDPVHFDKPPASVGLHFEKPMAGVGLCSEFARVIAKAEPDAVIGLIPCAVGSTSLEEWKVGGKLYTDAVARARVAMQSGTLEGILWHQGENDSAHEKVVTYADRFATMIAQLRQDLGAEKVPVVIGELGRFRPASAEYNAALPEIAGRVPLCAYVTAEDLTDKGDHLHFNTPSLHTFGARYAAAYLKLKSQNP